MESTTQAPACTLDGETKETPPSFQHKATKGSASRLIREVKRNTVRRFDAEYKIKIVLEGFRKEIPVSELCRRERINSSVYYLWLREFMEGGKARLKGATLREATKDETDNLKDENRRLKELAGEQALEMFVLKKRLL